MFWAGGSASGVKISVEWSGGFAAADGMSGQLTTAKSRLRLRDMANSKPAARVKVRRATKVDIPELIKLNIAAYPVLADENIVWGATHLESHMRIFPRGQFVAEVNGKIVGAAATLVVDMGPDPLRDHT